MENFRSMSCREGRMPMETYSYHNNYNTTPGGDHNIDENGDTEVPVPGAYPTSMKDLRSYSTSYAPGSCPSYYYDGAANQKGKKSQVHNNNNNSSNNGGKDGHNRSSSKGSNWSFTDPEIQRKKRVASYKVYSVEGKMKGSLRKSFRWIKNTCSHVVHGFR